MLLDLQALDVDDGQEERRHEHDADGADAHLHVEPAADRVAGHQEGAHGGDDAQQHDEPAVNAVDHDGPVPHRGHELEAREQRGRQDAPQMEDDADPVGARPRVVEALARQGARGPLVAAEDAPDVEVLEAGEGEAEEGPEEDEPQHKVVALGEADGVVDFAGSCHKGVGCRSVGLNHLVRLCSLFLVRKD